MCTPPSARKTCRSPAESYFRAGQARKREDLLAATEKDLAKIRASADAGRLDGAGEIGERAGKVIGKHKVGKHFLREITGSAFTFRRIRRRSPPRQPSTGYTSYAPA